MKVIADTNIWSFALRRRNPEQHSSTWALRELILSGSIIFLGPVRQELLTGFRIEAQFEKLKLYLRQFQDHPIRREEYELAATFQNTCSSRGVQGSPVDLLICAVAYSNNCEIFTLDKDFDHYQKHLPIKLYKYP